MFLTLLCSRSIQMSLSVLLLGVGVATVTDLQLNAVGSILSLLAIITTCIAQIVSFHQKLLFISHKLKFSYLIMLFLFSRIHTSKPSPVFMWLALVF
jgi:glycopeptide antibiotics resistance protein